MNRKLFLFTVCLFLVVHTVKAQNIGSYYLDSTTHGTTMEVPSTDMYLLSENADGNGHYSENKDYFMSIKGKCTDPKYLSLAVLIFDIYGGETIADGVVMEGDTLYFYDGPDTNSRLILKCNNNFNPLSSSNKIYAGPDNESGIITVRFKTGPFGVKSHMGFDFVTGCDIPCELVVPHISSTYYKYKDDEMYFKGQIEFVYQIDTAGDTIDQFFDVPVCIGDCVEFGAYGEYTNYTGHYTPSDSTSRFLWNFGNGQVFDSVGLTNPPLVCYEALDCYDVTLTMTDERGCQSKVTDGVRVRIAQNPIKTIYDLNTICNDDSLLVNVGYDGDNSTLTLSKLEFKKTESKTNEIRTFIPDGPRCQSPDGAPTNCYTAPVEFTEFPAGRTVQTKEDICSICINYEHTYMGDYQLSIICPNNQKAVLKYKDCPTGTGCPSGSYGGGGTFTGFPAGGPDFLSYDSSPECDSMGNPYGLGLDYCFSRNSAYTLIDGLPANTDQSGSHYLGNYEFTQSYHVEYPPIPAGFFHAGEVLVRDVTTKIPSVHSPDPDSNYNYYMPASDFSELEGCPLNGIWQIEVCDYLGRDNGWVFNWSLDICNINSGSGCEYQVGLDSVTWLPDSSRGDWLTGKYRGLTISQADSVNAYVASPDTAGNFRVLVTVYDEFHCVWDTSVGITTIWTPLPSLGNDTTLCSVESIVLDATDAHSATQNYTYAWEPYGQETGTIQTATYTGGSVTYVVEATNNVVSEGKRCVGLDTIVIDTKLQPIPSFDPGVYPLEGCEPFVFKGDNTSIDGAEYQWIFGDGDTSTERNPDHTYLAGTYDVKYYVKSEDGCIDSLIYPHLVTVFPNPVAKYSWEPVYPSVTNPVITMENRTTPDNPDNEYFWEFQYNVDNDYSFETLTDKNPTFEWYPTDTDDGELAGSYIVRLIARTTNYGPSGNKTQCIDTVENSILMVNDFLQFPNAVTPNGDGYNDTFEIINLVKGLGYPINRLEVFNKWGSRVFYAENIDSEQEFWDPNKTNSPDGTYYYHFVAKGYNGTIERNGVIEVVR